ncbi:MAG: PASTA domain-containing protein, partial [Clostridia bacterium]|nr:PASTA domain-containing protein [Clostridia bacterium]
GAGSVVTAQMPSAGAKLVVGGQMMLYTYTQNPPEPEELVCVPDVLGHSLAQAATLLRQRGMEMQIDGSGLAIRQEPAAGTYAARGTIVKVTFDLPNP